MDTNPSHPEQEVDTVEAAPPRKPTLLEALTPLVTMSILLGVGHAWLGYRIEVVLLGAAAVAGFVALRLGYSWRDMEQGIIASLSKAMPAIMILITVGALIATWIAAGTIPMLVYYGLKLISPRLYLVTACVICSIVSISTGTSWGTVGTVGIALIGVAQGLGIPMGAAAGAVVSGAYFGDKLSPFSDTTNLAPVIARANLFDHIKWMLWTTTPAWTLGLLVYLIVGLGISADAVVNVSTLEQGLQQAFRFNLVLLTPLAIILWFAVRKRPTLPGILLASLAATIIAVLYQGEPLKEVLEASILGYKPDTGVAELNGLLSRGGMMAMMDVTLIVFCAFGFAGIMSRSGLLDRILESLMAHIKSTFGLIASTVVTGITTALVTASSYLSIIIPGELFAEAFKSRGLAAKNLSRTTEDSGTVVVPLIPWSAAGVFMTATLGVPVLQYMPWAVMNYTGFIFALICAATGIGIAPRIRDDETLPGS